MADPDMDEFAQTRGDDDLFDDEIIPVSAEEQQAQTEVIAPEPKPEHESQDVHVPETPAPEKTTPRGETPQRGRGGERGRGRRGRGKGGRGGRESEQKRSESSPRKRTNANAPAVNVPEASPKPEKVDESTEQTGPEEGNGQVAVANSADAQRVPAVRGDRSATGGTRKVRCHIQHQGMRPLTVFSLNSPKKNYPSALLLPRRMP